LISELIYSLNQKDSELRFVENELNIKSPRKPWRKQNFVEEEVRGQARVRTIDKLDEACTNADDRMMLVRHRSSECVVCWHGFGQIS